MIKPGEQDMVFQILQADGTYKEIPARVIISGVSEIPFDPSATMQWPVELTLTGDWELSDEAKKWLHDTCWPRDRDLNIFPPRANFDMFAGWLKAELMVVR